MGAPKLADHIAYPNGVFDIEVIRDGPNGPVVIERRRAPNLVVNAGKKQMWRMVTGLNTDNFDQMRIGTCPGAPDSADTNVRTPVTGTINTVDSKSLLSGTRTMQLVISYPSGGGSKASNNISEVAVLSQNTSAGGSALAVATFTPVNKTTTDKLKITYSVRTT